MKTLIATVTSRQFKHQTVLSLINMAIRTESEIVPEIVTGVSLAEGRIHCVIKALKEGCTHILFVDDDMVFPADIIERLAAHNKEIVGVYSYVRSLPLTPTVALMDEDGNYLPYNKIPFVHKPDILFKAFGVGMGVCLIDMKVFQELPHPWFHVETEPDGRVITSEDIWFCKRAREKGFDSWCDPTIPIGHIGDYDYQE